MQYFIPVTNSPRSTETSFSSLAINVYKTIYLPEGSLENGNMSGSICKLTGDPAVVLFLSNESQSLVSPPANSLKMLIYYIFT